MNNKFKVNNFLAAITFVYAFIIYILTMAPTTSFWDCGEFIATSITLGVPHPPGTPFYLLLGNFFSQLPTYSDLGARVNLISPIFSALAVMFLYLIIVQLIEEWRGEVKSCQIVLSPTVVPSSAPLHLQLRILTGLMP